MYVRGFRAKDELTATPRSRCFAAFQAPRIFAKHLDLLLHQNMPEKRSCENESSYTKLVCLTNTEKAFEARMMSA